MNRLFLCTYIKKKCENNEFEYIHNESFLKK
jgi:hypothetical protein